MAWTYIAQRVNGEFLDWDLPIKVTDLGWQLSGPGSLRGTVAPDTGSLRAADGRLVLEEWGTYIFAESDGLIRWGGIVISSGFDDEVWSVEAAGFSTYPHGIPYLGEFSRIGVDPVDAVKEIWRHLQNFPDGNLNMQIIGSSTPVRLGTEGTPESIPGILLAARDILARLQSGAIYYEDWTWTGAPAHVGENNDLLLSAYPGAWDDRPAAIAWLTQYVNENADEKISAKDPEPYLLAWYEAPDCGGEIDDLAKSTPFDYIESHAWNGENIEHRFEIFYPRAGRRRDDLAFIQGDNVANVVSFQSNGDEYANEVNGLGGGEGPTTLRRTTAKRDGRLRRATVYSDKAVGDFARMDALIADELELRRGLLQVSSVDIIDHPNAPIGSWSLGDDVLIRCTVPWLGNVDIWCRVIGWSLTGENTATLDLARSDSFRYGG